MLRKKAFTKFWFYPYGPSNTVRDLAQAVGGKVLKREGSKYRKKNGHVVINWGASQCPHLPNLNAAIWVGVATSKMKTWDRLKDVGIPVPEWTEFRDEAIDWTPIGKVLGRDLDNGSGGRGITVYKKGEEVGHHKFYVKYWKKNRELRIHVFNGKVIFEQEKLKKNGAEDADKYIRSHDRGWVFAFNHLPENPIPDSVRETAIKAVAALGLNFGAVDCGWHRNNGCVVFEVNTAPGLEESSLKAYAQAIQGL